MINGDKMSYKNTTIAIDEDKLNLCKKRGIKLKSVLNDALDIVLKIENFSENSNFEIEKQDILNTLENLGVQHQEHIREYEKQVNELKTRLELIDGLILKSKTEYKANKQKDDYDEIIMALDKSLGDVESNPMAKQLIATYCMRYNIPDDDDFYSTLNQDYIGYIQDKSKR